MQKEFIFDIDSCGENIYINKVVRHKMKRMQSKLDKIGTHELNKISLGCFDDRRDVLDDGINTLAYHHKDIE